MKPALLDASCVVAWLLEESGSEVVEPLLTTGYITSVNMAECVGRIERQGDDGLAVAADLVGAGLTVVPVGWREVRTIAHLRRRERLEGWARMSLGDVTCLAYGLTQDMDIWTADRAWTDVDLPVSVRLVR